MKQITLSDHAGNQAQNAADQRQAAYDKQMALYHAEIMARTQHRTALKERSQQLFKDGRYFKWFTSLFSRLRHTLRSNPSRPRMAYASDKEHIWNAGAEGEARVEYLFSALSDDWTMISGYKNYKGEIDKILVGSAGVLAIEIKNVNGTIYVNGDQWKRDKYDRYGNCVETGIPITDKGGRSPSAQVNASADILQAFLTQRTGVKRVARAVLLAHERSRLGSIHAQTVELIATVREVKWRDVVSVLPNQAAPITNVSEIIELIRNDHRYHEERRQQRYAGNKG